VTLDGFLVSGSNYSFLTGAGISHDPPSNLPLALAFLTALVEQLPLSTDESSIIRGSILSGGLRFEQVMEMVGRHFDPKFDCLNLFARCTEANENHRLLAAACAAGAFVVTTNFDSLLERAAQDMGFGIRASFTEADFAHRTAPIPCIWKLHGTLLDNEGADARDSIAVALGQIGRLGEGFMLSPGRQRLLQDAVANADLVVLGYSGSDDFDIVPMLASLNSSRRVFWCLHQPSPIDAWTYTDFRRMGQNIGPVERLLAHGNWRESQIVIVQGRTTDLLRTVAERSGLFAAPPASRSEFVVESTYFVDWRYDHALAGWRTRAFAAELLTDLGLYGLARRSYLEAIAAVESLGDHVALEVLSDELARCDILFGAYSEARHWLERSTSAPKDGVASAGASTLLNLAICEAAEGRLDQAEETARRAEFAPGSLSPGALEHFKSCLYWKRGDLAKALGFGYDGLTRSRDAGRLSGVARVCTVLTEIHLKEENYSAALERIYEGLNATALTQEIDLHASALGWRARLMSRLGLFGAAFRDLTGACELLRRSEPKEDLARALDDLAALVDSIVERRKAVCASSSGILLTVFCDGVGSTSFAADASLGLPLPEATLDPRAVALRNSVALGLSSNHLSHSAFMMLSTMFLSIGGVLTPRVEGASAGLSVSGCDVLFAFDEVLEPAGCAQTYRSEAERIRNTSTL
jgi:tetratricopeptide (TPR) repeat protein